MKCKAVSRPSGKQLLIRECCARHAYRVMWNNCLGHCSRPIGMKKLSYKCRCSSPCYITFYWCYIIRSSNPSWCPLDQSEWINRLRYLRMFIHSQNSLKADQIIYHYLGLDWIGISVRGQGSVPWQESSWVTYGRVHSSVSQPDLVTLLSLHTGKYICKVIVVQSSH